MKSARALFAHTDGETWRACLAGYGRCLAHLARGDGGKRKPKPHLVGDDAYLRGDGRQLLARGVFTTEALERAMRWKLARGKFRVNLQKLAGSNSDKAVQDACAEGCRRIAAGEVRPALKAVAKLKGVGPATASLLLSLSAPDTVPFMSDEAYEACTGGKPKNYSEPEYLGFHKAVMEKVAALNKAGDGETDVNWTAESVERALWACWYAAEHGDDGGDDAVVDTPAAGGKRKADGGDGDAAPAKRAKKN